MSFEGMDVEQVQGIASQLDANARALDGMAGLLAILAGELSLHWQGPAAARFHQEWTSGHRQALHAAAEALTGMHATLVANITQQESASAAEAGLGAEVLHWGQVGLTAAGLVGFPVAMLEQTGQWAEKGGKENLWTYYKGDHAFTGLEDTQAFSWLKSDPVQKADDFLHFKGVYTAFHVLGWAGMGVAAVKVVGDAGKAANAYEAGNYGAAAGDVYDGVTDGLKGSGDPVLYGVGVDLTLAKDVAGLDWKDTPNPLSGDNFKQYYVPEIEQMGTFGFWRQAGGVLGNAL